MNPDWTASDATPPADPRPALPDPAFRPKAASHGFGAPVFTRPVVVAGSLLGVAAIAAAVAMIGAPPSSPTPSTSTSTSTSTSATVATAMAPTAAPQSYPGTSPAANDNDNANASGAAPSRDARSTGHAARAGTSHATASGGTAADGRGAAGGTTASPAEGTREVCVSCGTVVAVKAVTVQGQATGVGAVGGGAAGALVGSQVAGRHNHTLGAILGAIGGGLVGHQVEKHARQTTAYDVRLRMEDGSERTVRQATAPRVGARVDVRGTTLRPLDGGTAPAHPAAGTVAGNAAGTV